METKPEIVFGTKVCHLLGVTNTLNTLARLAIEAYVKGEDDSAKYHYGECTELLLALAEEVKEWRS